LHIYANTWFICFTVGLKEINFYMTTGTSEFCFYDLSNVKKNLIFLQ
jgi:hypothetical protein